jgi:hypothetical protein
MCVVSMVFDHFEKQFPTWPNVPNPMPSPPPPQVDLSGLFSVTREREEELRKLIKEFREAVEAAKKVDVLTKQPDCEDPEKAKLVDRVAELERRLDGIERPRKRRGKSR